MAEVIFITAHEAYLRSLENFQAQLRKNRQELRDLIDGATKKGEFSVIYDRQMFSEIQDWLNEYGYDVELQTVNNKSIWVISWENKIV